LINTNEAMLIRFVRGYWQEENRDKTTQEMLKKTLDWRKEMNVDQVLNKDLPQEEKYMQMWPHDYHENDKRQHIIYYERTCFSDPYKLLEALTEEQIQESHVQMLETLTWLKEKKSAEINCLCYKSIVIMDLKDFGWNHLSKTLYGMISKVTAIDQYYYPETLYKLFIINAPFSFRALWTVVKPWLHPLTQARIQITGGESDYLPIFKTLVDEVNIPRYIGGSCDCCTDESLDKQINAKLERNRKWRQERIDAAKPKEEAAKPKEDEAKI